MRGLVVVFGLCLLSGAVALLLSPLYEGLIRKLRAVLHSRRGPPVTQPYLDLLKLLGKEDLRSARGSLGAAAPAVALGATLLLALLVPLAGRVPLSFAGDFIVVLYVATMSTVAMMVGAFASGSPYAFVGGSREMMLLLCVEPVIAACMLVVAVKARTLTLGGMVAWQLANGPTLSTTIAGAVFFLALQAQAGKLPFDIPEADQELLGGTLVEQSGPRLALFRWALWVKQLALALLLVELFVPWPRAGNLVLDASLSLAKALVALILVGVVEVVNPRLRIDQAMSYFVGVGLVSLAALAFAVVGI